MARGEGRGEKGGRRGVASRPRSGASAAGTFARAGVSHAGQSYQPERTEWGEGRGGGVATPIAAPSFIPGGGWRRE